LAVNNISSIFKRSPYDLAYVYVHGKKFSSFSNIMKINCSFKKHSFNITG